VILAPSAWGQGIDIPMLVTGTHGPDTWTSAQYAHQFEVKVDKPSKAVDRDGTRAEMARDSLQIVAGHRFQLNDDVFMVANAAYQGTYYDFAKGTGSLTQLRWSGIHQGTVMLAVGWKVDESWTLVGLGLGRISGEAGADFGDSLTGGGALVVDYEWSETLSTGLIIGVLSQLEDSAGLLPIPTVDWRFSDGWLLHFGVVGMTYPGVGPEVSYRSDKWEVAMGGSYQSRRYRLDERSGSTNEGIGQETSFPIYVRAGWSPNENVSLGVTAGVTVGGEIRSGDESGRRVFKENYNAAPMAGLQASFRF
jgi:hypothetical protein